MSSSGYTHTPSSADRNAICVDTLTTARSTIADGGDALKWYKDNANSAAAESTAESKYKSYQRSVNDLVPCLQTAGEHCTDPELKDEVASKVKDLKESLTQVSKAFDAWKEGRQTE